MKIPVSLLNEYSFCPRSVYLSQVLKLEPDSITQMEKGVFSQELRKRLLLRQMSLLAKANDTAFLISALRDELDRAYGKVRLKFSSLSDEEAVGVKKEVLADLCAFSERLDYIAEDIGFEKALDKMTPWKVDYAVSSDNLGLSGRIDKVIKESFCYPVEIKTCSPPESVWDGDRLQVCAYGLLLEEVLATDKILYGFVEYTRIPEMRPVMFTETLRKNVLKTRSGVCSLFEGEVPDICPHGNGRKCESCGYSRGCYEI